MGQNPSWSAPLKTPYPDTSQRTCCTQNSWRPAALIAVENQLNSEQLDPLHSEQLRSWGPSELRTLEDLLLSEKLRIGCTHHSWSTAWQLHRSPNSLKASQEIYSQGNRSAAFLPLWRVPSRKAPQVVWYSQWHKPTRRPEATQGKRGRLHIVTQINKQQGYPDGEGKVQNHKQQKPKYMGIIRTQFVHYSKTWINQHTWKSWICPKILPHGDSRVFLGGYQ